MKDLLRTGDPISYLGAKHTVLSVRVKDGTQTVCIVNADGSGHSASTITDVDHADFAFIPVTKDYLKEQGYEQDEPGLYIREYRNGFAAVDFRKCHGRDDKPLFTALLKKNSNPIARDVRLKGVHHLGHLIDDLDLD